MSSDQMLARFRSLSSTLWARVTNLSDAQHDATTLVEIEAIPDDTSVPRRRLDTDAEQRGVLSELLQLGLRGAVGSSQVLGNSSTFRMVLSPEMQAALKAGTAEMVDKGRGLSGNIVNKTTKEVVGRAYFQSARAAKLANVVTMGWQVAAMVTAQHYLAEINGRLDRISGQLTDVTDYLEDQDTGRLLGSFQTLKRVRGVLASKSVDHHDRQMINEDVRAAFRLAEAQVEHRLLAIGRLCQQAPEHDQAVLSKTLEQIGKHGRPLALALTTMVQALAVSTACGWSEALTDGYRKSNAEALDRAKASMTGVQDLVVAPEQKKLELTAPRSTPWILQGPRHIVDEIGSRVDAQRQKRREEWYRRQQDILEVAVLPAMGHFAALKASVDEMYQLALPAGSVNSFSLVARLDEHGDVVEVFVETASVF